MEFELEEHHLKLLRLACEAFDRCQQARQILAREGLTFLDRFGKPAVHPAVAVERDSRLAFCRVLRELALDVNEPEGPMRPPAIRGKAGLRK